jgi:hypothetical protein
LLIYPAGQVIKALTVTEYISKVVFDVCGPSVAVQKAMVAVALCKDIIINLLQLE